jgi:hypothetical protein
MSATRPASPSRSFDELPGGDAVAHREVLTALALVADLPERAHLAHPSIVAEYSDNEIAAQPGVSWLTVNRPARAGTSRSTRDQRVTRAALRIVHRLGHGRSSLRTARESEPFAFNGPDPAPHARVLAARLARVVVTTGRPRRWHAGTTAGVSGCLDTSRQRKAAALCTDARATRPDRRSRRCLLVVRSGSLPAPGAAARATSGWAEHVVDQARGRPVMRADKVSPGRLRDRSARRQLGVTSNYLRADSSASRDR